MNECNPLSLKSPQKLKLSWNIVTEITLVVCWTSYLRSLAHLFDSNYSHTILSATRTLRICLFTGVLVESRFALQCLLASKLYYYQHAYSKHLCKNHVLLTDNLLIRYFGVWTGSHNSLTITRISKILTLCATYKDRWSFSPNLEASASRLSRLLDDSAKILVFS